MPTRLNGDTLTTKIIIAQQIYGPGKVWFDDLSAEYTNDPPTDPTGS
jgi:hypothetical protein